jgi:hypothetical protein
MINEFGFGLMGAREMVFGDAFAHLAREEGMTASVIQFLHKTNIAWWLEK